MAEERHLTSRGISFIINVGDVMSQNLRFRLPGEVDCFQKPVSGLGVTLHQWEGIMGGDLLPLVPQIW